MPLHCRRQHLYTVDSVIRNRNWSSSFNSTKFSELHINMELSQLRVGDFL